ncbi:MAG: ribulose-phosphate 3-epimerase, partial [Deltaproteobacteria bacterium]
LAGRIAREKLLVDLEVDGGVKVENIARLRRAGANVFVAGSAIFESPDYRSTIRRMREEIARADRRLV